MQPMTHERLQAFLERNQKLVSTPKSSNQLEHKHSSSSSSAISTSDAKGKTDNLKDKRSVSPIHARDLSNINSDQRGNSDSFLSSDKDLQPFINYKSPTVNLIPEIDYLYSYATNNNTTLKSPLKISDNNERDNFFRDQEYYSAQKSPFKKDNLFDFKSNPEVVKTSSRSVSPRSQSNSKKDNLSNRLEAYLVSKKKFQDKLKENYTKDLKAKSAVKVQTANTPKSSLNSSSSKIFKKQRSPLKTAPFSIAVPNYAKPTESKKSKESRGNSPEFPLKSRSITPSKSKSKIEFYFYEESSSNSKIKTDRTPKKKEDLSRSRSGILKNATPSKTPDKLVQEKTIPDKGSTKKKVKLEDDNLFGASSRKLQDIDESLDKDSIYKYMTIT